MCVCETRVLTWVQRWLQPGKALHGTVSIASFGCLWLKPGKTTKIAKKIHCLPLGKKWSQIAMQVHQWVLTRRYQEVWKPVRKQKIILVIIHLYTFDWFSTALDTEQQTSICHVPTHNFPQKGRFDLRWHYSMAPQNPWLPWWLTLDIPFIFLHHLPIYPIHIYVRTLIIIQYIIIMSKI